ncbi:hypothetical protein M5689_012809 [Euphorbia peplus]|nr:hypothetical protein M5689_012809 [Euphorbia peplus]
MSDLTKKTPPIKPLTRSTHKSAEFGDFDGSPERKEPKETPRSTIHNKDASTRNLDEAFEEEDLDDEPSSSDIFWIMRSMQHAQDQQPTQQRVLVDQHMSMKEENQKILQLLHERLVKSTSEMIPVENVGNEPPSVENAGHLFQLSQSPREHHKIKRTPKILPQTKAELEIQFE